MACRKKKKMIPRKENKDFIEPTKKPEKFTAVDSSIWWEANPDKSKKYGKKEFKKKEFLTPKEALIFLGVTEVWLSYFVHGEKGFPKLPYTWKDNNKATAKFARKDLVEYREMLRSRKLSTNARPQRK
jgi:hypothetical protein